MKHNTIERVLVGNIIVQTTNGDKPVLTTTRKHQAFETVMQDPNFKAMLSGYGGKVDKLTIFQIEHCAFTPFWYIRYDIFDTSVDRSGIGTFTFEVPWLAGKCYCNECGFPSFDYATSCVRCGVKFAKKETN